MATSPDKASRHAFQAGTQSVRNRGLADGLPLVCVDIGFGQGKTTGIATLNHSDDPTESMTFGEAERWLVGCAHEHQQLMLVLEAPLSGKFDCDHNQIARGEFEGAGEDSGARRYWHTQSGAGVMLATAFLLSRLAGRVKANRRIYLFEAFVSGRQPTPKRYNPHLYDARLIRQEFKGKADFQPVLGKGDERVDSLIGLLSGEYRPAPPVLVIANETNLIDP